jgi:hypothetical protein
VRPNNASALRRMISKTIRTRYRCAHISKPSITPKRSNLVPRIVSRDPGSLPLPASGITAGPFSSSSRSPFLAKQDRPNGLSTDSANPQEKRYRRHEAGRSRR